MRTMKLAFVALVLLSITISCCTKKTTTVSKEKQEQIDKDKSDFEKNVQ